MTRGTLYFIGDKVLQSTEFNGDMYQGGHYEDAVKELQEATDEPSFINAVHKFNLEHHNYKEESLVFPFPQEFIFGSLEGDEMLRVFDFSHDYFKEYFSDYLFFKNESGKDVNFIDKDTKAVTKLPSGKVATFNFGTLVEII